MNKNTSIYLTISAIGLCILSLTISLLFTGFHTFQFAIQSLTLLLCIAILIAKTRNNKRVASATEGIQRSNRDQLARVYKQEGRLFERAYQIQNASLDLIAKVEHLQKQSKNLVSIGELSDVRTLANKLLAITNDTHTELLIEVTQPSSKLLNGKNSANEALFQSKQTFQK